MKVKELMEELATLDPELEVVLNEIYEPIVELVEEDELYPARVMILPVER